MDIYRIDLRHHKRRSGYMVKELLKIHQGKFDIAQMFAMARKNLKVKIELNQVL